MIAAKWVGPIMGKYFKRDRFIRKIENKKAFGITSPLITNPDGSK